MFKIIKCSYLLCIVFLFLLIFLSLNGIVSADTDEVKFNSNDLSSKTELLNLKTETPETTKLLKGYWDMLLISMLIIIIFLIFSFYIMFINSKLKRTQKELFIHKENLEELVKQRSQELYNSEEFLRTILNAADDIAFVTTDIDGVDSKIISFSPGAEKIFGYSKKEIIGEKVIVLHKQDVDINYSKKQNELLNGGKGFSGESELIKKSGEVFPVFFTVHPIKDKSGNLIGIVGVIIDITERKQMEINHEELKIQFNQIQKMESVGRLAGGIAHDYNNMLSVIIGYSDMAMKQIKEDNIIYSNLQEISKAASRSAHITRQLLAFARKQTINPHIINLNENIDNTLKMLKRLIGENINIGLTSDKELWPVLIDPGQLDHLLATLCIYSKSKIKEKGEINIRTENIIFDEEYCKLNIEFIPGSYIALSLNHNGEGIDEKKINHIFEPFYLNEGNNKNIDLSLPTVYGIVKQNMGIIKVNNDTESGTTFKIYLPRQKEIVSKISNDKKKEIKLIQKKSVLLVEDEEAVLNLCKTMLKMKGFEVFSTNNPEQAVKIAEENPHIDILVTDVIMPEMNGKELSDKVIEINPKIKCLFISGYTSDVIGENGILDQNTNFLEKPFVVQDLHKKICEILQD